MISRTRTPNVRWLPNYVKALGPVAGLSTMWQVASLDRAGKDMPAPVVVPGLGKIWLRAALHDHSIFQQVWIKREYDLARAAPRHFPALQQHYQAALARGVKPLILDAGAHVGLSVLWWRHLFPEARIVAIEPSSANLAVLKRNVVQLKDVTILHAALSAEPGSLRIANTVAGGSAVRLTSEGTGEDVPAMTVADVLAQVEAEEILLAKIDIEGGEAALFATNLAWLDQTHALAVETHDWLYPGEGTSRTLFAAIAARHYDFLTHGENVLLFRC
jgi:FkbM family methyltransferase